MSQTQPPMIGSWQVLVHSVRPYTIHSDLYYELQVTRVDVAEPHGYAVRVPQHAATQPPQVGDRLELTFLMGQITSAKMLS
jgi:hypothetical protein